MLRGESRIQFHQNLWPRTAKSRIVNDLGWFDGIHRHPYDSPLRMFAIVSDIHGNFEALTTVFAEIEKRGIEHVVCLGDIVVMGRIPWNALTWSENDAGRR